MEVVMLSPDSKFFEGQAQSVQLTGLDGSFEILPNHAPLIASLAEGEIVLTNDKGRPLRFFAQSGFVECLNNKISLLLQGAKSL